MKLRIELRRIGTSRVSMECIPLVARVMKSGGGYGDDLLQGSGGLSDVECAKRSLQSMLDAKLGGFSGAGVEIEWVDATGDREPGDGD